MCMCACTRVDATESCKTLFPLSLSLARALHFRHVKRIENNNVVRSAAGYLLFSPPSPFFFTSLPLQQQQQSREYACVPQFYIRPGSLLFLFLRACLSRVPTVYTYIYVYMQRGERDLSFVSAHVSAPCSLLVSLSRRRKTSGYLGRERARAAVRFSRFFRFNLSPRRRVSLLLAVIYIYRIVMYI